MTWTWPDAARRRAANLAALLVHLRADDFGRVLLELLQHVLGHGTSRLPVV